MSLLHNELVHVLLPLPANHERSSRVQSWYLCFLERIVWVAIGLTDFLWSVFCFFQSQQQLLSSKLECVQSFKEAILAEAKCTESNLLTPFSRKGSGAKTQTQSALKLLQVEAATLYKKGIKWFPGKVFNCISPVCCKNLHCASTFLLRATVWKRKLLYSGLLPAAYSGTQGLACFIPAGGVESEVWIRQVSTREIPCVWLPAEQNSTPGLSKTLTFSIDSITFQMHIFLLQWLSATPTIINAHSLI